MAEDRALLEEAWQAVYALAKEVDPDKEPDMEVLCPKLTGLLRDSNGVSK